MTDLSPRTGAGGDGIAAPKRRRNLVPLVVLGLVLVAGGVIVTQFLRSAVDYYCNVDEIGVRDGAESVTVPAVLSRKGQDVWQLRSVLSPDELIDVSAGATIIDVFADTTIDGEVVSDRVVWGGGAASMWLPYPTLTRKLSLKRGAA